MKYQEFVNEVNNRGLNHFAVLTQKRELENLYSKEGVMSLNYQSCEMIARELAKYIQTKYPNRALSISVAEDNENGCRLVWE